VTADALDRWLRDEEETAEAEELPWQITGRNEERWVLEQIDSAAAERLGVSLEEVRARLLTAREARRRGRG
jgi:hypothetical protein